MKTEHSNGSLTQMMEKLSMGVSCASVRRIRHAGASELRPAGSLMISHSFPAKTRADDKSDNRPYRALMMRAAQFLQMLHEGHAQHAALFFVLRRGRRRRGRRRRRLDQTGLAHFRRPSRRRIVGNPLPRWGVPVETSLPVGRRRSLLLVVHSCLRLPASFKITPHNAAGRQFLYGLRRPPRLGAG